ncbi:hypothetical protein [Paenarthrobacter aurescens]|uniref:hypothetical protein n=1 Tax=Paenarthrobacter aurescens TaxID=43663 RepID=UPI0035ED1E9A
MSSEPLSESTPRIENGRATVLSLVAAKSHPSVLFLTNRVSVQPVATSALST